MNIKETYIFDYFYSMVVNGYSESDGFMQIHNIDRLEFPEIPKNAFYLRIDNSSERTIKYFTIEDVLIWKKNQSEINKFNKS